MYYQTYDMSVTGSVGKPTLTTYLIDTPDGLLVKERPLVLICPGGGYNHVSAREGEFPALQFLAAGSHAALLNYSVSPAVYPTQLLELARALAFLRAHAKEWRIRADRIFVQGSSAGGHLAASLGCFWEEDFLRDAVGAQSAEQIRPDGLILSYPVITAGEYAHRDSFVKLLGDRYEELLAKMSLENQVTAHTPPTFLWHTYEDQAVPVENSLLFMQALRRAGVPFECHIYPKGCHGLGLGTELTCSENGKELQPEVAAWVSAAAAFVMNL